MVLKSFPGRSLRKTWNAGDKRFKRWQALLVVSKISETTNRVLGPEEQPESAMHKHLAKVL